MTPRMLNRPLPICSRRLSKFASSHLLFENFINSRALATAATEVEAPVNSSEVTEPAPKFNILSGVIVARSPIITPELTPFEKVYYKYQLELRKRLQWTFTHWFYFPRGSVHDLQYREAQIPVDAKPDEFGNKPDILLGRDRRSKQDVQLPKRDVEKETAESERLYRKIEPQSRITEADRTGNVHSLDRKLDRTLYLVVKIQGNNAERWVFPTTPVGKSESLHDAAERWFSESGGQNLNRWIVSNSPAVVHKTKYTLVNGQKTEGSRIFYLKAKVFAGQFVPESGNGILDYAWLTKEEVQELVPPSIWSDLGKALSSQ
ncbi:39S mitochondrial ribosomal protein L46-domain-containing protein [Lipomyces japonicus]|uniref:mitochondrial 54S ribosomal protein mL46 n=1 Tax=Lipomyces japonicus TaxID=56871 RepID=UPI0034CE42E2